MHSVSYLAVCFHSIYRYYGRDLSQWKSEIVGKNNQFLSLLLLLLQRSGVMDIVCKESDTIYFHVILFASEWVFISVFSFICSLLPGRS